MAISPIFSESRSESLDHTELPQQKLISRIWIACPSLSVAPTTRIQLHLFCGVYKSLLDKVVGKIFGQLEVSKQIGVEQCCFRDFKIFNADDHCFRANGKNFH